MISAEIGHTRMSGIGSDALDGVVRGESTLWSEDATDTVESLLMQLSLRVAILVSGDVDILFDYSMLHSSTFNEMKKILGKKNGRLERSAFSYHK